MAKMNPDGTYNMDNWNFFEELFGTAASKRAANAQIQGNQQASAQLDQYLSPYVQAGEQALGQQGVLAGLKGGAAQQEAFGDIRDSDAFQYTLQQGEEAMLRQASATGGLRGGNTQAALAQFSPALLQQAVQQQYGQLGGLTGMGAQMAGVMGSGKANIAQSTGNIHASQQMAAYQMPRDFLFDTAGLAINFATMAGGGGGAAGLAGLAAGAGKGFAAGAGAGGGLAAGAGVGGATVATPPWSTDSMGWDVPVSTTPMGWDVPVSQPMAAPVSQPMAAPVSQPMGSEIGGQSFAIQPIETPLYAGDGQGLYFPGSNPYNNMSRRR